MDAGRIRDGRGGSTRRLSWTTQLANRALHDLARDRVGRKRCSRRTMLTKPAAPAKSELREANSQSSGVSERG